LRIRICAFIHILNYFITIHSNKQYFKSIQIYYLNDNRITLIYMLIITFKTNSYITGSAFVFSLKSYFQKSNRSSPMENQLYKNQVAFEILNILHQIQWDCFHTLFDHQIFPNLLHRLHLIQSRTHLRWLRPKSQNYSYSIHFLHPGLNHFIHLYIIDNHL